MAKGAGIELTLDQTEKQKTGPEAQKPSPETGATGGDEDKLKTVGGALLAGKGWRTAVVSRDTTAPLPNTKIDFVDPAVRSMMDQAAQERDADPGKSAVIENPDGSMTVARANSDQIYHYEFDKGTPPALERITGNDGKTFTKNQAGAWQVTEPTGEKYKTKATFDVNQKGDLIQKSADPSVNKEVWRADGYYERWNTSGGNVVLRPGGATDSIKFSDGRTAQFTYSPEALARKEGKDTKPETMTITDTDGQVQALIRQKGPQLLLELPDGKGGLTRQTLQGKGQIDPGLQYEGGVSIRLTSRDGKNTSVFFAADKDNKEALGELTSKPVDGGVLEATRAAQGGNVGADYADPRGETRAGGNGGSRNLAEMNVRDVVAFASDPARREEFRQAFKEKYGLDPNLDPKSPLYESKAREMAQELGKTAGKTAEIGVAAEMAERLVLKALGIVQ